MDEMKKAPEMAEINESREIAQRLDALPPDVRRDVQKMVIGAITAVELMGKAEPSKGGAA